MADRTNVKASDIVNALDWACEQDVAQEIAERCNAVAQRHNVTEWELSLEGFGTAKALYFDGWTADGREVSHVKLWSL